MHCMMIYNIPRFFWYFLIAEIVVFAQKYLNDALVVLIHWYNAIFYVKFYVYVPMNFLVLAPS